MVDAQLADAQADAQVNAQTNIEADSQADPRGNARPDDATPDVRIDAQRRHRQNPGAYPIHYAPQVATHSYSQSNASTNVQAVSSAAWTTVPATIARTRAGSFGDMTAI
mmetsp:Transcript_54400/g.115549  ORF Transcript_54400/g.115549 Transcript_54400/m.115549 type:complete len:109 (+) Transcript_54400:522-848(+)